MNRELVIRNRQRTRALNVPLLRRLIRHTLEKELGVKNYELGFQFVESDEMARVNPWLKVVHHEKNRGYGGALRTGFETASKELVLYTDGDAQYDPREFALLLDAYSEDVDFVNGYKISRNDPFHRKVIGRVYHHFVKLAFGLKVRDVDCDFRLMRKSVFDKVKLTRSSGVICVELMKKVTDFNFRIAQVPVHHYHRTYGKSQFFNFPRVFRTLRDLVNLWAELSLSKTHLKSVART